VGYYVLAAAQLMGNFAWSFVQVTLPFYIKDISPYDTATTLRWIGWILGVTGLVTVPSAAVWGWLAARVSPKRLYVAAVAGQAATFVLMAWAVTLPGLFLIRLVLGVIGAASTLGFIMVGAVPGADLRRGVSLFQSALTAGQIFGPLAGAVTAARLGFDRSFVLAGLLLLVSALVVAWGVPASAPVLPPPPGETAAWPEVVGISVLCLAGTAQIAFLPAILPDLLADFGVEAGRRLPAAGLVVFASGAAAAVGSFTAPRLADALGARSALRAMVYGSGVGLALMAAAPTVWVFGAVRAAQVFCIAPVFPLLLAQVAGRVRGQTLGLVNSSRIAASFIGPLVATSILAYGAPAAVYALLAVAPLPCLPFALRHAGRRGAAP
jgi:MFS transporter, DHA1 family, multidrug resistance protein